MHSNKTDHPCSFSLTIQHHQQKVKIIWEQVALTITYCQLIIGEDEQHTKADAQSWHCVIVCHALTKLHTIKIFGEESAVFQD
jgi:hypothetical protein